MGARFSFRSEKGCGKSQILVRNRIQISRFGPYPPNKNLGAVPPKVLTLRDAENLTMQNASINHYKTNLEQGGLILCF